MSERIKILGKELVITFIEGVVTSVENQRDTHYNQKRHVLANVSYLERTTSETTKFYFTDKDGGAHYSSIDQSFPLTVGHTIRTMYCANVGAELMHPISHYNVSLNKFAINTTINDFNKQFDIVPSFGGASMGFGCLGFTIFGMLWLAADASSMVSKSIHWSTVAGSLSVFFIAFIIYQYFAQTIKGSMLGDSLKYELQKLMERVKVNPA